VLSGVWCVVCGVWCVVCGVWCVVCGVWCVVCGVWCGRAGGLGCELAAPPGGVLGQGIAEASRARAWPLQRPAGRQASRARAAHLVVGQEARQVLLARLQQHCEVAAVDDLQPQGARLPHQVPARRARPARALSRAGRGSCTAGLGQAGALARPAPGAPAPSRAPRAARGPLARRPAGKPWPAARAPPT
jgi:hypothetical protein